MPCQFEDVGHSPTDFPKAVEQQARMMSDHPSSEDVLKLFESLPGETPSRGSVGDDTKSWTTGAYAQGSFRGLRTNTNLFPSCTEVICRFLRRRAPKRTFAALAIFQNLQSKRHRDVNNDPRFCNILVPLTLFEAGGVWIESPQGTVPAPDNPSLKGVVMSVQPGPCFLDAQLAHATMPWEGKRILLVGFTPNGAWEDVARAKLLLDLGFVPPSDFRLPGALQRTPSHTAVPHPGTPDGGPIRPALDPPLPKPSRVPYLLELFCGSAGVSSAFIRLGGEALGIDRCLLPRSIKAPGVRLDLTRASDQALFLDEVRRADIIWMAPPCGTCSRAREIPLKTPPGAPKLKAEPLRSATCPEGLPTLSGVAGRRVRLANQLYVFAAQVVALCVRLDKVCVLENPSRSWFWSTKWIKPWLCRLHSLHSHACMYGAGLKKATRLLCTHQLPSMQAKCDGAHSHQSWGVINRQGQLGFRTTGTAEYPSAFCKAAASDFMDICASRNAFPAQEVVSEAFGVASAVGRQPRGLSFQAGPSEFGSTCTMRVPISVLVPEVIDGHAPWPLQGLPLGSRLLNSRTMTGEGGENSVREVKFGIFRTPDSFLREALKMRHPFDEPSTSDMGNIRAMQVVLERGVEDTKNLRQKTLDYYRRRELELRSDEEALKVFMISPI